MFQKILRCTSISPHCEKAKPGTWQGRTAAGQVLFSRPLVTDRSSAPPPIDFGGAWCSPTPYFTKVPPAAVPFLCCPALSHPQSSENLPQVSNFTLAWALPIHLPIHLRHDFPVFSFKLLQSLLKRFHCIPIDESPHPSLPIVPDNHQNTLYIHEFPCSGSHMTMGHMTQALRCLASFHLSMLAGSHTGQQEMAPLSFV